MSYKKCQNFDKKTTSSIGVWYDKVAHNFKSAVIDLSALKDFKGTVRVVLIKNKFYEKDSNKPNYVMYITDSKSSNPRVIEILDYDVDNIDSVDLDDDDDEIEVYTREQVRKIINGTASDIRYGLDEYDILPEDFAEPYYVKERYLD